MTINEFLQGDKFALLAGVELLETGNGYAKARMEIKPEHLNGGGVCQGGEAREAFSHKRLANCEVRITNETGDLIATFNGTGYRKDTELPFAPIE